MPKLLILFIALGTMTLSGCETIKGAGRDLQNAGHAIDRAVN